MNGAPAHTPPAPLPPSPTETLAEERHPEHRRRRHLEVQQQGDGPRGRESEPEEQEDRAHDATEQHRARETHAVRAVEPGYGPTVERGDGTDTERRPDVEKPGELKGGEVGQQHLASRRRSAEERGGDEREEKAVHPGPLRGTLYPSESGKKTRPARISSINHSARPFFIPHPTRPLPPSPRYGSHPGGPARWRRC